LSTGSRRAFSFARFGGSVHSARVAFSNSLGISFRTETGSTSALGMVGSRGVLRILGINDIDIEAAAFVVHRVVFDLSQDYVTGACEFDEDRAIDALSDMIYRYLFKSSA